MREDNKRRTQPSRAQAVFLASELISELVRLRRAGHAIAASLLSQLGGTVYLLQVRAQLELIARDEVRTAEELRTRRMMK